MRDLRNQCVAKANDFCTDISATVAAKANELCTGVSEKVAATASCPVQQCRGAAADLRRLGNIINGSYGTGGSFGSASGASANATTSRTVLQHPPQASDFVILRIAKEMYDAHPNWQAQHKLSLQEFQGKMLMVCRTPNFPCVDVGEAVDEEQDNHVVQIVKLHYEYLQQKNDEAMLAEFVCMYPIVEDAVSRAKCRKVQFAADAVQVAADAKQVAANAIVMLDPPVQDDADAITQAIDVVVLGWLHDIITEAVHDEEVAELEQFGDSLLVTP